MWKNENMRSPYLQVTKELCQLSCRRGTVELIRPVGQPPVGQPSVVLCSWWPGAVWPVCRVSACAVVPCGSALQGQAECCRGARRLRSPGGFVLRALLVGALTPRSYGREDLREHLEEVGAEPGSGCVGG